MIRTPRLKKTDVTFSATTQITNEKVTYQQKKYPRLSVVM